MHTSLAKKIFAVGSSVAMLLGALVPAVASAAVHADGTNVSSNGTVYFVSQGSKRPYTSAGAFLSYGFNSWSGVVAASAEDLALPTGAFVPPADGSLINDKGTVYLITNGQRAGFTSAANFLGLGYAWSNVIPGDTSFMSNGALIGTTAMAHPVGTLVNQSGTVYLMTTGGKMGIPSLSVFNSWGYSFKTVAPANSYDNAISMSSGIMPARVAGQLSPAVNGGTTPVVNTGVSAALASDNPAAGTIVATQAQADLAHFTFTGSGTITALTFQRLGVSANDTASNVYVFDGATRLTDAGSFNSNGQVTFAGLNLVVNGPKTVAVKSDIKTGTSGQTLGIGLSGYTVGTTSTAASVNGNLFTVATASLATVALSLPTGSVTDPGSDLTVWQGTATVGTRDVTLTRLALRQIGSISSNDINSFRLLVDGTQVASVSNLDANGYVTFTPNVVVKTGARTLKVLANVVGGSSRTLQMSLRGAYDISATDSSYGVGIVATASAFPFGPSASTVATGTLSVAKASNSPSGNLTLGASDQVLARYTFTAYGEAVKVETLKVGGTFTVAADGSATLRNGRVMVNGSQVGSTATLTAAGTTFTTNFIVNPGTPATVEVRADVYNEHDAANPIAAGDTLTVTLKTVADNGVPQVSLTPIHVPTADLSANQLIVASGTVSMAKTANYADQTAVSPQTGYKIASFQLTGNSTEAVNVNTFDLDIAVAGGPAITDVTDVYIKYGTNQTSLKPTVAATGNTWSPSFTLGKNETMQVDVYASFNSTFAAADTIAATLEISGTTADSGTSATTGAVAGQTITMGTGAIAASLDASSPAAQLVDDSGSVTTAAYKFTATNDSYTITDVTVLVTNASAVAAVKLMDGSTVLGTRPGATSVTFSGLSIPVPANTNKVLQVALDMSPVGVGAGTSDSALTTSLDVSLTKASNSQGVNAALTGSDVAGKAMYAYKAVPVLTAVNLPNADLAAGAGKTIAKFTVSSNGTGTIAWKQIMLEVSKTATPTLASYGLYNADTGEAITADFNVNNDTASNNAIDGADTAGEIVVTIGTDADDDAMEFVSGAKTYEVRATIGGAIAATDNISVTVDRNSASHVAKAAFTTAHNSGAANNVSFVWSDESASTTGDTAATTWLSDYLVKNLPLNWSLN